MNIEVRTQGFTLGVHGMAGLRAQVAYAVRGFEGDLRSVEVVVTRSQSARGRVRYAAHVGVTRADGSGFVVRDSASYPSSAVERASYLVWEALALVNTLDPRAA